MYDPKVAGHLSVLTPHPTTPKQLAFEGTLKRGSVWFGLNRLMQGGESWVGFVDEVTLQSTTDSNTTDSNNLSLC